MSADTRSTSLRRIPVPVALLIGANALTQFAIQAWMAYGFADKVWKLRHPLPWGAPVALDVFAVTMMVLTYHLRNAHWRTRAYAWFWLGVAIAAQVGASEGFADHERWSVWGRVASIFPAVFLAASLHALIIVARRREHSLAAVEPVEVAARRPGLVARWRAWRAPRLVADALADALAAPAARPSLAFATAHAIASRQPVEVPSLPLPVAVAELAPPPAVEAAPEPAAEPWPAGPSVLTPEQIEAAEALGPVLAAQVGAEQREAARAARAARRAARRPAPAAPARGGRQAGPRDPRWGDVIKRCLDADPPEDAKTVGQALGVKPRTAQLWVSKEREARAVTSRAATPTPADDGEILQGGPVATDAPVPKRSEA
jgi:hypothetical protein